MNTTNDSPAKTQLEPSEKIMNFINGITLASPADLVDLKIKMRHALKVIPYDDTTREREERQRWTRTAAKIFDDGFIFSKNACTDLVILFMGLCAAAGLETRFVKVKKEYPQMHSIAEIKLNGEWYIYDLADNNNPEKGEIHPNVIYRGWYLWKKGRDSWDVDLCKFEDMEKIWQ